jgi:hypothetical protein
MDWPNERYVRVYTRDTTTWKLMDWRGRAVLSLLIRKVDRAGVLDVGHDGVLGLAAVLELPVDIAEAGIAQLTTARGGLPTVVDTGTAYVLPNYIEAQEAPQSDPQRKRESRARRRDVALAVSRKLLLAAGSDLGGHETGRERDENAEEVTPIRSDPSLSGSELSPACAIPPDPVPVAPAPTPPTPAYDPDSPRDRGQLAEATYRRVSDARIALAAELKLPAQIQFPAITPSSNPKGFVELRDRVREEGGAAPTVCELVVGNLIAQARASKSIDWLSLKSFSSGAWAHAREWVPKFAATATPARSRRKPDPPLQVSTLTPEELLAMAAESRAILGIGDGARAPPRSTSDTTTDEQQPEPAARKPA